MHNFRSIALPAVLAIVACAQPARAETTGCTQISSLPAVIGVQGVYCLKQDLSTSLDTGAAITVATNNVTIDCNGRKLGGLGGGPASMANGILSLGRSNITVRNCSIRGFRNGVLLSINGPGATVPSGIVVEDNLFEGNLRTGITVVADGSVVRRNRVIDTGSTLPQSVASGIQVVNGVDVIDNMVDGVSGVGFPSDTGPQYVIGIDGTASETAVVKGNIVRRITGEAPFGIYLFNEWPGTVLGNILINAPDALAQAGIACESAGTVVARNLVTGFGPDAIANCSDQGNTVVD